jgi:hypothetical protein
VTAVRAIAAVLAGSIPAVTFLVPTMRWTQPCIGAARWEVCSRDDNSLEIPCYWGVCDVFEPWWWTTLKLITHLGCFVVAGAVAQAIARTRFPVAAAMAGVTTAYLAAWAASYVYPHGPKGSDSTVVEFLLGILLLGGLGALGALGGWLFARATTRR